MNLEGFEFTGRCNCVGRPMKWVHPSGIYAKRWDYGSWKLFDKSGRVVRYGNNTSDMETEVKQYMNSL